jgi:hypothetical protein
MTSIVRTTARKPKLPKKSKGKVVIAGRVKVERTVPVMRTPVLKLFEELDNEFPIEEYCFNPRHFDGMVPTGQFRNLKFYFKTPEDKLIDLDINNLVVEVEYYED